MRALLLLLAFAGTVQAQTFVPPATSIIDSQGSTWTLNGGIDVLRNGGSTGGRGSLIGYGTDAIVKVLGTDGGWWRWTGFGWSPTTAPAGAPPPPPPPPPPPTGGGDLYDQLASLDSLCAIRNCAATGSDSVALGQNAIVDFADNGVAIGWNLLVPQSSFQAWCLMLNCYARRSGTISYAYGGFSSVAGSDQRYVQFGDSPTIFSRATGQSIGNAQGLMFVMKAVTTNTTPTQVTLGGSIPSLAFNNILTIPANATVAGRGTMVARDGQGYATWDVRLTGNRNGGGAVTCVGAATPMDSAGAGGLWHVSVAPDQPNASCAVYVTGGITKVQWLFQFSGAENISAQ